MGCVTEYTGNLRSGNNPMTCDLSDDVESSQARLRQLAELRDGWFDGTGSAVSAAAMEAAHLVLAARPDVAVSAAIFPTQQGGLTVEFVRRKWDMSIEIAPDGSVHAVGVELDGQEETETDSFDAVDQAFLTALDACTGE